MYLFTVHVKFGGKKLVRPLWVGQAYHNNKEYIKIKYFNTPSFPTASNEQNKEGTINIIFTHGITNTCKTLLWNQS